MGVSREHDPACRSRPVDRTRAVSVPSGRRLSSLDALYRIVKRLSVYSHRHSPQSETHRLSPRPPQPPCAHVSDTAPHIAHLNMRARRCSVHHISDTPKKCCTRLMPPHNHHNIRYAPHHTRHSHSTHTLTHTSGREAFRLTTRWRGAQHIERAIPMAHHAHGPQMAHAMLIPDPDQTSGGSA